MFNMMYPSTPLFNYNNNNPYNNNNVMNMNNDYINNDIQQIIIRRSPKKNINMEDTLDRTFMDALKEIELNYISLSKPLRLRIEKWIEKLCTVSGVNTWRKERNIYARLLLNMILRRQLTEPFHQYPPDGSLPNLANHLKRNPDDLGSHESQFWRSLYKRVGVSPNKNNYNSNNNNKSYSNIDIEENNTNINHNHNINEIKNLNNLVREQAIRIKLLEQQLHDERIQTELQIQRLQHLHRVELNNFQQQATNMYSGSSSSGGGSSSSSSSNHINSNIVDNHHNFVHNIIKKTEIQSNSPFVDNFIHNMESEINNNATTTPLKYENISSSSIANNNNNNNNKNNMSQKPTDPEAFLAYLDKFQNEIKKL